MVTKIINHLVFEPAKVSIMANCGSGITIGSTHTTAPIGEGSLTVVVYTTLPNENILINFNYEDSSCSPTMTLTTAINPECIEVKIIEIECIEPEIPIISYDCDNGLVISNFDNNLTYNYLPGAFLTEGNYVLTVSNNGCIKEVPFTVQSCCFNYGVIANYSCSTKKLNITIYDTVTDSYIPGNPNWVVNADIADPAHCTSYVNPIPMTYFPSGSISMSSTGTLNLCDGSYSINIYLQVNNSCIIGTTVLVDCHCDININVTVDYTCNSKELIVNTTCTNCNVYIKKLNANGFLFGDVPDDGTVLPLFPFYGKYPKNDYYYSIPSVNTLLAVNSFINSNDLGQLGSLSNGYYLVVLENGDCYTIYKFRVSCNEIECNLIHYDEGDVNDTDIRVIDVTGITGNVYIDLMTGGYPDSIELYYSNNNTATLSSLTSDTILVRTPPIVDYKCLTLPNQVINGFWQNNIGTGVAGNPYIWNGVNTSLYSISDNVPVDFTIPGSTWIATYPHAGGNPFDNYYSIPLSVYTANISNIDSGNYNGVYITSTNAYLSNDHMFISSSGRLNFNLDGSKNYIKLRLRYNENSCRQFFSDGITPWLSGFVYNFPYCCTIPNFRGGAGSCYANTDGGYVFATFNTAHTNMSIKFLVSTNLITNPGYVAQQYTGKYLGYGACPGNTCSSYIQLGAGTLNGSYMEYETVNNSVDVVSGDSVFALFNNSSGSILNLPNGEYKFIFIDGDCTAETSFTVNCECTIPNFRTSFGLCYVDTNEGYAYTSLNSSHTSLQVKFLVDITNPNYIGNEHEFDNMYLGYGACISSCTNYVQLGVGVLVGGYMEYTTTNLISLNSFESIYAIFSDSAGTIYSLSDGNYKFVLIEGACTNEVSVTVDCGCITPALKSPFVGFLVTDPSSAYFTFEILTTHSSGVITVGIKNPSAGYVTGQYDNQWLKLAPTTITDPSAYGTNIYYVQLLHESTPSIPGYDDTYKTAAVSLVSPVKIWGIYDNASNTFPPHNPIDVTNCEKLLFSITDGTCNGSSTVPITAVACESCESELTSFNVYPAISFYNDYLLGTVDHYFGNIPSSANGTVVDVTTDLNNGAYMWSLPDRVAQPAYLQAKDTANSDTLITNGLPDNQFIPISFTSNTMNNNNISLTPTNVSTLHDTWIYHNSTDNAQYYAILGLAMTNFVCIPGSDNMRLDIELQVQIPATNVVINSTNITNNNIVGQLLSTGSYPGVTTLIFGVMTSHGNNNVTVDLDLTNTTATSNVPAFTNLAQSFNLTFNLDCTDDCEVCNPTYTIVSANPCNASNGSVTIDNFDLCDNTTFYLNGTPINLGINGWDNLSAGIYTLQYTSNDGCINSEQIEILNTSSTISFDVNDITLLCGSENSLINIINISGGVSPYDIEIKNSIGAILESATGITTSNYTSTTLFNSGLYNITVKDSLSCVSSSLMNIIPCSTPLTFTHSVINSTCNGSNGSIRIDGLVGTNTVAIKLNGTNDVDGGCSCSFMTGWTTSIITTTNYTFNSLAAGSYQVCIENSNECCYCKTITVNNDGYNCIASCGTSNRNILSSSVGTNQLNGLCDRTICQGQNLSFYFALSGTNCNLTPTFKLDGNTISNTVLTGGYGVVLSGLSAGVHTLNVSYGICGDDIDYIITVVAKPIINTISNITVCNGGSVNIDITGTVGANYTYTHNNTSIIGIANSGSGTIDGSPDISFTAINNTTTPKVVTFTVTPIGVNCNGTPVTFNVTINPTPSIVLNDIIKCKGQLVSTISLPSTYTWTNNNTSIGLAASGTGSIPSFTTLNSGTAIITVTPIQLGCIGTPETFEIFVEDAPVTSPVNNIAVCHNSIIPEIDFVSTITSFYTWTSSINLGVGYSGSGSFPSFTAANLGTTPLVSTITVYTNSELGCPGNTITFTITVYPKLADTTVHEIEICQNQMLNYDCSIDNCVSGTGSYSSSHLPVGFSLNSITGIVSGSTNLVSTISFTINFICNHGNGVECTMSNNYVLTTVCCRNPPPVLSSNSNTFNSNSIYTYVINIINDFKCCLSSSPNGTTYLFSSIVSNTTGFNYVGIFTNPVYNLLIPANTYTHPTTIYFRAVCALSLEAAIQCINNPGCNTNWSNVITLSTTA